MEENSKSLYIKRTQRDYPMSFKLAVVREVESGAITNTGAMLKYGIQGHGTIVEWRRKFGNFEVGNTVTTNFMKRPQQKIAELEQKVRLLERQNAFLQQELEDATDKAGILDKIIEIAEEELECDLGTQQRIVAQSVATYNKLRPHLSCGMLTPDEMHRQSKKVIATYRTKNDNTARRVVI
ncbi:MAG: hypothetical protein J6Q62_07025 [Alistipes sp.]|nr:hypothetical protein [Alistipes sp.]